ncbi:MAM and LDL-receptor class A domain-containing protein 1-like [Lytechinus variegatus]|uniref:MAM and LDL-receptor class A domain-containing protein 1-like n=1 Tax=Lytechinus variegatus TaxID=7654 RepID=UPI001BB0FB93|nr:MAM and LDL-receptor class A domain-containing protein 1-like [Lytechinus variegatus]
MFVDGTTSSTKQTARLISPVFKMAPRGCTFYMWFYMFGPEYGDLKVKLLDESGESHVTKALDNALQYNKWYEWESQIPTCTENFQVVVESQDTLQVPTESGFALDDVSFVDCEFPDQVAVGQCPQGTRQCNTGECYPINQHCDMELNCCDGTDEANCDIQGYSSCDFENGICDWQQLLNDDFDWTWQQGGTPDNWRRTGPQYDHTTGTVEGWYVYTESSDRRRNGDRAVMVSFPIVGVTSGKECAVRFFYHMEGQGIGTLNVYTRTAINGPLNLLWSQDRQTGEQWNYQNLELNEENDFQVVFEGVIGYTAESDIGLDDISFTPDCKRGNSLPEVSTPDGVFCIPEELPCNGNTCIDRAKYCDFKQDCGEENEDERDCPDSCDFERDLCSWTQDDTDEMDWSMFTARTVPSGYKGPATDHTTGSAQGRYIYVDGSTSRTGQKARLISPEYKLAPRGCTFNMWFYMFGPEYGDLEVKLRDDRGQSHVTKVQDNALQYNRWYNWNSQILPCTQNFQIVIESEDKLQGPIESGFAVDDLSFTDCAFPETVDIGTCPSDTMQCGTWECYPAVNHCDMELDCCDGTDETDCESQGYIQCDFEQGLCDNQWEQLTTDEFDWTWQQGGTPDNWRRTGPQYDHTKGDEYGWYYYTESSDRRKNGERARLASFPIAADTSGDCRIRFFYHMEGQGIGTLNVYTRTAINGPLSKIWSQDRQMGEQWNYDNLELRLTNDFQVIFEGVVGYTAESDIGLDDISFAKECRRAASGLPIVATEKLTTPKPDRPTIPSCLGGRFTCLADGSCIDESMLCDGKSDCPDSQDEASCPAGKDNNPVAIGLGVTFGFLFVAVLAGGVAYYIKIYSKKTPKLVNNEMAPGVSNPAYGNNPASFSMEKTDTQA